MLNSSGRQTTLEKLHIGKYGEMHAYDPCCYELQINFSLIKRLDLEKFKLFLLELVINIFSIRILINILNNKIKERFNMFFGQLT